MELFAASFLFVSLLLHVSADETTSVKKARIVGGVNADPGEYPFFVQWGGCGASLVWKDVLLSAAHCNVLRTNDVLCGAYVSQTEQGYPVNSVKRRIVDRRVHPDYESQTYKNDFLVLKLDNSVEIPPVSLNEDGLIPTEELPLTVIGLGVTQAQIKMTSSGAGSNFTIDVSPEMKTENGETSKVLRATDILQEVDLKAIGHQTCNGINMYRGHIDKDSMLCAGFKEGGKDACYGDSGGPLFLRQGEGFSQVGIVSFGSGCARPNRPGVYSRISGAYDWIQEQICDLSSEPPTSCQEVLGTLKPSTYPTANHSEEPSRFPTPTPTSRPSRVASSRPSPIPTTSYQPSLRPSRTPSSSPRPTSTPSLTPSAFKQASSSSQLPTPPVSTPPTLQGDLEMPALLPTETPTHGWWRWPNWIRGPRHVRKRTTP